MYYPVDQSFPHSLEGKEFFDRYGVVGEGVHSLILRVLADTEDGQIGIDKLPLLAKHINLPENTVIEIVCFLVSAGQLLHDELAQTLTNRLIAESKLQLEKKREVFNKNKKLRTSTQTSAQTSEQTSYDVLCCELLLKDPSKKKYLDCVLLSDAEFEALEKRFAKDGLEKRDLQRAIELLNSWFLNNPQKRKTRTADHRALTDWPLREVLEEKAVRVRLANQQNMQSKYPPKQGVSAPKGPPRGFEVSDDSAPKMEVRRVDGQAGENAGRGIAVNGVQSVQHSVPSSEVNEVEAENKTYQ